MRLVREYLGTDGGDFGPLEGVILRESMPDLAIAAEYQL
jgi:hypothetical protein